MRILKILMLVVMLSVLVLAQNQNEKTVEVTVTDPATVSMEKLKQQADLVAYVQILSGDTENFDKTLYKAKIMKPFKGCEKDKYIYFIPFNGYGIGNEYLVFLKRTNKTIQDIRLKGTDETQILFRNSDTLFQIMYEGYSIMPIKYVCVFGGNTPRENCDYGVNINIYQILIPKNIKTFPRKDTETSDSDSKWVRKEIITNYLLSL